MGRWDEDEESRKEEESRSREEEDDRQDRWDNPMKEEDERVIPRT
jgi:hypothetical protein